VGAGGKGTRRGPALRPRAASGPAVVLVIGRFALLALAAGAGCELARWRGYPYAFGAAAQRRIAAEVDASALPLDDSIEGDLA
jgi:hypothetical protein